MPEPRAPLHDEREPDPRAAERRLRDRVLAGDTRAARELFERHAEALYEFVAYRIGRERAATEDIVQETWLVAVDKLGEWRAESSLHSWLCGIAKNKLRAARRKLRPVRIDDLLEQADDEIDAILARVRSEPLPDEVLERAETRELVGATLSSLPPDYRRLLLDKYVEGHSVPELALASGRGIKATESTLFRARKAFARVFELLAGKRGGEA